jgi:signal transduction histidine kinase
MTDLVESSTSTRAPGAGVPGDAAAEGSSLSARAARERIEELTTALAARDSFIALLGHELRNSVAPMVLLAEQFRTLADDPRAPALVVSRMALLTRNIHKFVATIDRVAEVADLRRGHLRLDPSTVDLVNVARDASRELEREAIAAGAEIIIDAPAPVTGQWDRVRLKQIVANLVSNAVRYGGGGRVEIAVLAHGDEAELVVRDHGPGIDRAALPRLFEPFDHHRPRPNGGFGIGLWLVKTLCTAMRGSVSADNATTGGTRFCVVLPRG